MAGITPICLSNGTSTNSTTKQIKTGKKIRATIFFDGTLNNATNTSIRLNGNYPTRPNEETSYQNNYSNIYLLRKFHIADTANGYDEHIPMYVEGIGTVDKGTDSDDGAALGYGETGLKEKVNKCLNILIKAIKNFLKCPDIKLDELRIDVFGFSRGAAAARHFVNILLNPTTSFKNGELVVDNYPLQQILAQQQYQIEKVKVYFVGLFESVSAYGLNGTLLENSNVEELGLNAIRDADAVFHLASSDEHRKMFALTNINSVGAKGKEIFLPGVHCDIGGSYNDKLEEKLKLLPTLKTFEYEMTEQGQRRLSENKYAEIETELNELINQGWFEKTNLYFKDGSRPLNKNEKLSEAVNEYGEVFVKRIGSNGGGIRNFYSRIPMHLMIDKASTYGLSFCQHYLIDLETNITKGEVPTTISEAYDFFKKYVDNTNLKIPQTLMNELRMTHFHFSASYKEITKMFIKVIPNEPRYLNKVRTRLIHDG